GNGDGSFKPARGYITAADPVAVAAFDVDGDGTVDLLSANEGPGAAEPSLALLRGTSGGAFTGIDQLAAPASGDSVAVADFDEDAFADAAVAFLDDAEVGLFPGGPGAIPSPGRVFPVGASPVALVAADVNHDGHTDVVTLDSTAQISVLLGDGTGA